MRQHHQPPVIREIRLLLLQTTINSDEKSLDQSIDSPVNNTENEISCDELHNETDFNVQDWVLVKYRSRHQYVGEILHVTDEEDAPYHVNFLRVHGTKQILFTYTKGRR